MPQSSFIANAATAAAARTWFVVDATGKPLGRLASEIAKVLRGKHKASYTPHVDTGDHVVVVNADKVKLTGQKLDKKFYYHHSGIPGGFKAVPWARRSATSRSAKATSRSSTTSSTWRPASSR